MIPEHTGGHARHTQAFVKLRFWGCWTPWPCWDLIWRKFLLQLWKVKRFLLINPYLLFCAFVLAPSSIFTAPSLLDKDPASSPILKHALALPHLCGESWEKELVWATSDLLILVLSGVVCHLLYVRESCLYIYAHIREYCLHAYVYVKNLDCMHIHMLGDLACMCIAALWRWTLLTELKLLALE